MRVFLLAAAFAVGLADPVLAFCGFYVSTGDAPFNEASKVVLARFGSRTSITMTSDVGGDPKDFAVVIPVPTVIQRDQVHVLISATVEHLEAYTVPRLVQYFDEDPCAPPPPRLAMMMPLPAPMASMAAPGGVRIEAQYSVGEYDIQVLSATDSNGLVAYLNGQNYRIPVGAGPVIASYLKQNLRFFVAKVNMQRLAGGSTRFLRPIRVDYESAKFMLPIRLGTVNARGAQDMIVLALSENGRIETTNYQTRRMPTGVDVPLYLEGGFNAFYRAVFDRQVDDADGRATFLEYAWDLGQCDPCSAPPMRSDELQALGVPSGNGRQPFVTRLHVRYDRDHFPEDLALQETRDRENYQIRFVMRHPARTVGSCPAGQRYTAALPGRARTEARNVVELTNWSYDEVRQKMEASGVKVP